MAYNGTIPALSNLISNDIPAMQENFSLLESAQVVDEGSTADGDYIRYENGWQICRSISFAVDATIQRSSGIYRTNGGEKVWWSFPASFISTPYVKSTLAKDSGIEGEDGIAIDSEAAATEVYLSAANIDRSVTGVVIEAIAIGRWK